MSQVFISYRDTDDAQGRRVRGFAVRLRDSGVKIILDQFYLDENPGGPPEGWPQWCSDQVVQAQKVLIIGDDAWFRCFTGSEKTGTGRGAACEAGDLRTLIYNANNRNEHIRVVVFDPADAAQMPLKLQPYHLFQVERDFSKIVKWLGCTPPSGQAAAVSSVPVGAARVSPSIPNNLPSLQSFFGREKELREIAETLHPDSRTWGTVIDGPGGMGKTSLAVRAAYDCPPGSFERIVFISIKDRELDDDGVRLYGSSFIIPGLLELFNELARELDKPEITRSLPADRIRLLLDALRGQRILLILDNLETLIKEDRDEIFTFVKRLPQGCKAILTSRRRIGSSADSFILPQLAREAALETLAELARRNHLLERSTEAERIQLYEQTGGKPLLLRWTAGQLGRGRCRTVADALAFLRSCPKDNDALEFIFGDLAREFTAEEEKILCALSYYTLPARVKHIATLAELDEGAAGSALDGLANRSLVVPDQEEERYALVPMVADFLRKHRPHVIRETGDRLECNAYAAIVENGRERHDRFHLLEELWDSITPALPLFLAGPNERLQKVCADLDTFLLFTGRWDQVLALHENAEAVAKAAGDDRRAGWRAFRVGLLHFFRGRGDEVLESAKRVARYWENSGGRKQTYAIKLRGLGLQAKGDCEGALAAFRESLELRRGIDPHCKDVALALNDLAVSEHIAGDIEEAKRGYTEAREMARAIGYSEGVAEFTGNLADVALEGGEWQASEDLSREALALSAKLGRQELIARDSRRLAESLYRQGRASEALPHARRAVEIYAGLRAPDLEAARATLRECEGAAAPV